MFKGQLGRGTLGLDFRETIQAVLYKPDGVSSDAQNCHFPLTLGKLKLSMPQFHLQNEDILILKNSLLDG